jgi:hypothetical protein
MEGNRMKQEMITEILKWNFKEKSTKINGDAQKLASDLLCTFIHEAVYRTAAQAKSETASVVDVHHFEKILPKLLLDF